MAEWRCSPTELNPTAHFVVVDYLGNALELNAVNAQGSPDIRAARSSPVPKTNLQVASGSGEFSKYRPPYGQFTKSDWSGGLGMMDDGKDATRFWHASGLWTTSPNGVMLAPELYHGTIPWPYKLTNMPGRGDTTTSFDMTGVSDYAVKFTPTSNMTIRGARVLVQPVGTPGTIRVSLYSHNAGSNQPNAELVFSTNTIHTLGQTERFYGFASTALTSGTTYWFALRVTPSNDNYLRLQTLANTSFISKQRYADDNDWSSSTLPLCFSLVPVNDVKDAGTFRYKWADYIWETDTDNVTHLFMNGDRGMADDNTAAKTTLIDATKSWTVDEWKGAVARIYSGEGSGEFRVILSNTATALTCDRAWNTTHTTSTVYVITGSRQWQEIGSHGLSAVEDTTVSKEGIVYFAQGDTKAIRRMREYNSSGTWTREFADDVSDGSSRLISVYDQKIGSAVWRARNASYGDIQRAPAAAWGTNLVFETEIPVSGVEQDINGLLEADQKLYVTKMDALWAVNDGVPAKLMDWPLGWDRNSGRRPCLFSPYVVFPVRGGLVRVYGTLMETWGPEQDDGVTRRYQSVARDLIPLSSMGGLLAAYHAGNWSWINGVYVGESGVYAYRHGWHAAAHLGYGTGLYAIHWQNLDTLRNLLWMVTGEGVYYMPAPSVWDYRKDAAFNQAEATAWTAPHLRKTGYMMLGRMTAGTLALDKWWPRVTLYGELHSDYVDVEVYYRTSDVETEAAYGDALNKQSYWTYAGVTLDGQESEATFTIEAESKELYLMLVLKGDGSHTPVIRAVTVDYLTRTEDATSWSIPIRLSDMGVHLGGAAQAQGVKTAYDLINLWVASPRPLELHAVTPTAHGKNVLVLRPGLQALTFNKDLRAANGRETDYATITLLEV